MFSPRRDWLVAAFLVLLPFAAFFDLASGSTGLYMRDLARFFYPGKKILREVVLSGELPEWNRYLAGGQPLAANPQNEVFYPLNWLILLRDFHIGFHLQILLHICVTLVGMYAFLRSLDLGRTASLIGSLSWGMGAAYLSLTNLLPFLFSVAWLPIVCLFSRRFIERRDVRDFVFAALAYAMQMLVGEPTTIVQTALLVAAYAVYHAWNSSPRRQSLLRNALVVATLCFAAALLAAIQILPGFDLAGDSVRSRPFSFELVSAWSMPWAKLLEWFFPNVLGHISIDGSLQYWAEFLYPRRGVPFVFCLYSGILVPITAYAGFRGGGRKVWFVAIVGLCLLLIAAGEHTPLLRLLYESGIARSIRYPEKFVLLLAFVLIAFSATVFDRVLRGEETVRRRAFHAAVVVAVFAVVMAAMTLAPAFPAMMGVLWQKSGPMPQPLVNLVRQDWILVLLRAGVAAGLLYLLPRISQRIWAPLAVVFVLVDIFPVAQQINPRMPRQYFNPSPLAAELPGQREQYRLFHAADWVGRPDANRYFPATEIESARRFSYSGSASYWLLRNSMAPMLPASAGIQSVMERDYDRTHLLPTVDFTDAIWRVIRQRPRELAGIPMAMSNAWFIARHRDFEQELQRTSGHLEQAIPVEIVPGLRMPRYYFAGAVVTIHGPDDFVRKLVEGSWPPNVAFVPRAAFTPASGTVLRVHETTNSATLDVRAAGRAFLVMSVTPHKYWQIQVDGRSVPSIVTNVGYQGIELPAGTHRIVMRYRNPLLRAGGAISVVSLLALTAFALRRH